MRKGKKEDYLKILEFVNRQFKEDFVTFVPKIYSNDLGALNHFIIEENNEIVATCCFIESYYLGSKYIGIGSICVDPQFRNKGYMSSLINKVLDLEADLYFLLGDRKRYEHYGFYKTGCKTTFTLTRFDYLSEKMEKIVNPDPKWLDSAFKSYDSLKLLKRDKDSFYDVLKTGRNDIYQLENGGYLVFNSNTETILEIVGEKDLLASIKGLMNKLEIAKINIEVAKDNKDYQKLYSYAAKVSESTLASIKINNYPKIIKSLLAKKNNIPHGQMVIELEDVKLEIIVDEEIKVEITDKEADFVLSNKQFHFLLFSRYPLNINRNINSLISSWFPLELPVTLNTLDRI